MYVLYVFVCARACVCVCVFPRACFCVDGHVHVPYALYLSFLVSQFDFLISSAVEMKEAVDCVEELVKLRGVDVALVGPNDLSIALGGMCLHVV